MPQRPATRNARAVQKAPTSSSRSTAPPPADSKDCTYLAPYVAEYDGADAGKTAHYMLRWNMNDRPLGAFGEMISATITG